VSAHVPVQRARSVDLDRVATSDFVARGGDGFAVLARLPRVRARAEAPLLRETLAAYFRRIGTVRAIEANRIATTPRR